MKSTLMKHSRTRPGPRDEWVLSHVPAAATRRALLSLVAAAALGACTSPEPNYFTLRALPGSPQPGSFKLVELRRIGLAGYLDRPEIVRNNADYRLSIGSNERWGEPLGNLVARILAEDLTLRLPGTSVFTSAGSISADPDATLEIEVQRFDADANGQVVLLAQVAASRTRARAAAARTIRLVVTPAGPATTDLVAAMSSALAQLADQIAPLLRA
jgi:uncharacterized lipoprotein YmbA